MAQQAPPMPTLAPSTLLPSGTTISPPPEQTLQTPHSLGQVSKCPDEFLCPITMGLMKDPVLLVETGHSFERAAIERWFQNGNGTCPLTGVALTSKQVSPNVTLRKLMEDWAGRHPTHSAVLSATSSQMGDLYPNPFTFPAPSGGTIAPPSGVPASSHGVPAIPGGNWAPVWWTPIGDAGNGPTVQSAMPHAPRNTSFRNMLGSCFGPRSNRQQAAASGDLMPPADDDEPLEVEVLPDASEEVPAAAAVDANPTLALVSEFDMVGKQCQELLVLAHVEAPDTRGRVPTDLVAVLDVSYSMSGGRLDLVKETMMFVISQLQPSDRLSIVAFSTDAKRAIKLTRATDAGKEKLKAAVRALGPIGGTSILSGLKLGLHVLTSRRQSNPVACMFLLSDGQDSMERTAFGELSRPLLASAMESGIPVHTFGYGSDHDEQVLDSICAGTNGTFSYVHGNMEVKEAVAQSLGGALSVALQATTVHLTAASGVAILSVSAGVYATSVDDGHMSASTALKDVYSGETRDFLVKLQVAAADDRLSPTDLLSGWLEYTIPGREEPNRSDPVVLSVARGNAPEGVGANIEIGIQRSRLHAADAIKNADALAAAGHLGPAHDLIASAIVAITQSASATAPACAGVLDDLHRVARGFATSHAYQSEGAKTAKSAARSHASQRATYTSFQLDGPQQSGLVSQYSTPRAVAMRRTSSRASDW